MAHSMCDANVTVMCGWGQLWVGSVVGGEGYCFKAEWFSHPLELISAHT